MMMLSQTAGTTMYCLHSPLSGDRPSGDGDIHTSAFVYIHDCVPKILQTQQEHICMHTYLYVEHNITNDHKKKKFILKTSCAHIVHVHINTRGTLHTLVGEHFNIMRVFSCTLRIMYIIIMVFVPAFRKLGGVYSPDKSDRLTTYTFIQHHKNAQEE